MLHLVGEIGREVLVVELGVLVELDIEIYARRLEFHKLLQICAERNHAKRDVRDDRPELALALLNRTDVARR